MLIGVVNGLGITGFCPVIFYGGKNEHATCTHIRNEIGGKYCTF